MYSKRFLAGASRRMFTNLQCFCDWIRATKNFGDFFVHVIALFIFALLLDVSSNPPSYFESTTPALNFPEITHAKHYI